MVSKDEIPLEASPLRSSLLASTEAEQEWLPVMLASEEGPGDASPGGTRNAAAVARARAVKVSSASVLRAPAVAVA